MSSSGHACAGAVAPRRGEGPEYAGHPELAVAAVLYLLSRFPARHSPAVAQAIVDHLRLIESDARLAECVRGCAASLIEDWRGYAALSAHDGAGVPH